MAVATGGGAWSRMTPRERTYVMVLVLTFFAMATVVLLYFRGTALDETEKEIDGYRRALDDLHTRGAVYKSKIEQKQAREKAISVECAQFATLLDEAKAAVENVSFSNEEEQPSVDVGAGLTKCSYKFDAKSITLEDLTKLLTFLESRPGQLISTENLVIRSLGAAEDRLNADITLISFRREGEAPEDGAELPEEGP
ncbi:MAG: hypothetical protein IPH07_09560 [Deltaproteobacteria bacterium]|nr:hypothetical protein [Deltaproteobacteria bacterium]MBK8236982.1 hypothetical protein [Deltaproteobacteria bacterium]MBK8719193.1 hypothetical protein [Deltaproteobacteria bacterium]MBP7290870.1 hypothetical protein [Nannocystaceae bacterium]